jgi:hypothetical protein
MRKLSLFIGVAVMAACAMADPRTATLSAATGTNTTATSNTLRIEGYVDEIILELPSGATSGRVSVAAQPLIGGAVVIATNTLSVTTRIRPRIDGTDTTGSGLTSDPPDRYLSCGDAFTATVTGADVTGKTWRVSVRFDDRK